MFPKDKDYKAKWINSIKYNILLFLRKLSCARSVIFLGSCLEKSPLYNGSCHRQVKLLVNTRYLKRKISHIGGRKSDIPSFEELLFASLFSQLYSLFFSSSPELIRSESCAFILVFMAARHLEISL